MKEFHCTLIISIWKLFDKMTQIKVWSHPPNLVQQIQQAHSPYYITVDAITEKKVAIKAILFSENKIYLISCKTYIFVSYAHKKKRME